MGRASGASLGPGTYNRPLLRKNILSAKVRELRFSNTCVANIKSGRRIWGEDATMSLEVKDLTVEQLQSIIRQAVE